MAGRRRARPEAVGPGQESVWDYPRPPRLERDHRHVVVEFGGGIVVDTTAAYRVLETSHPPTWYLPMDDVVEGVLRDNPRTSYCEFKGRATYLDVVGADGRVATAAGWTYPQPTPGFEPLRETLALYPAAMDRCLVDGEVVRAVQGDFYGGWVTDDVVGPFKGEAPDSMWW